MRLHSTVFCAVALSIAARAAAPQTATRGRASDRRTYAQLWVMTDTRESDTALVNHALASRWQGLRAAAALAIGQLGTEGGSIIAPRLGPLVTDSDTSVAANAAYALGLLRDTASIG